MSGKKIIDGLRAAIAGDLARVTINGQTWVRVSAAPVMAEATGWQEISSAPKDGTPILAYKPDEPRTGDYTAVVYWGEWPYGDEGWIAVAGNKVRPPTHWMRIPDPPAINAALAIAAGQPPTNAR